MDASGVRLGSVRDTRDRTPGRFDSAPAGHAQRVQEGLPRWQPEKGKIMKKLAIATHLDDKVAIRLGLAESGDGSYPLAEVLPFLQAETRKWLERVWYVSGDGPGKLWPESRERAVELNAAPSAESVARGIESMRAEIEARRREEEEEREARIAGALSAPPADWIGESNSGPYWSDAGIYRYRPIVYESPRGFYLHAEERQDPRILVLRECIATTILQPALAEWAQHKEAYDRETEAKAAAEAAAKAARVQAAEDAKANVLLWAKERGEGFGLPATVVRAANEGRNVTRTVRDFLDVRVQQAIENLIPIGFRTSGESSLAPTTYAAETDGRVPSERSYAVRDSVVAGMPQILAAAAIEGATIAVGEFERYSVEEGRSQVWRTGFDVHVEHPWFPDYEFGYRVLTEPLNYPREDSDD